MKRKIIQFFACVSLLATMLFGLVFASGCYVVKSSKMKDIVGTYQLTTYSERENELEKQGMSCYIVVKSDGNGWLAYKDNDTPLFVAETRYRFIAASDDASKYEYVELSLKGSSQWHKLGVNSSVKNLNSREAKMKGNIFDGNYGIDYYIDIKFSRKDKAVDLSYVQEQLGALPTALPYGGILLDGLYESSWREGVDESVLTEMGYEEPTVYSYFIFNLYTGKATVLYMLKSDETQREETYDLVITGSDKSFTAKIGQKEYSIEIISTSVRMVITEKLDYQGTEYELKHNYNRIGQETEFDYQASIQNKINVYQEWKDQVSNAE